MSSIRYLLATIGILFISWCAYLVTFGHMAIRGESDSNAPYLSEESPAIVAIERQLKSLSKLLEPVAMSVEKPKPMAAVPDNTRLMSRLSGMEARLERLERAINKVIPSDAGSEDERRINEVHTLARRVDDYTPYAGGETAFELDDGIILGSYSDTIYDSFHEISDVVQVQDFQCKQSICRIAYSGHGAEHDRLSESEDPGTAIVDKLSDNLIGANLDIRFSSDTGGNQVMYVQLK